MPFISSFDPRRSLLKNGGGLGSSSSYSSTGLVSRALDRSSSSRKSGVFERPSMYNSSSPTSETITSKYRPSTLERLKNGSDTTKSSFTSSLPQPSTSPTSYSSSYKATSPILLRPEVSVPSTRPSKFETPLPSYQRMDSLPNPRDSVGVEPPNQSFKSFNNGFNEAQQTSLLTPPSSSATSQTPKSKFSNGGSLAASELTKRISNTLAKHGIDESKTSNKRNSYVDSYSSLGSNSKDNGLYKASGSGDYLSNSLGWRRKLDESYPDDNVIIEKKTVMSRATSPQPDSSKQVRTRIAKNTDPEVFEKRKTRNPRVYDVACQTDPHVDFQPMAEYLAQVREERAAAARLKLLTAPSFDYFAHVKKSMELSDCETKRSRISATPSFDMDDDDYYKTEKAPMMALLPGSRCSAEFVSPVKKTSFQSVESTKSDEESEYTYDEEEYEEEEEENGFHKNEAKEATYEAQAEKVLEDQNGFKDASPDLDYIDGEEDEVGIPIVTSPKRKRKGAFISGTIDIDILLGKDTTPTSLVAFGASPPTASDEVKPFFEFALPSTSQEVLEDLPWWLKINSKDMGGQDLTNSPQKRIDKTSPSPDPNENSKCAELPCLDLLAKGVDNYEEDEEEEEEEEEEDDEVEGVEVESGKGEEGDWEWEYYETEGEEKSEDPQELEELQGSSVPQPESNDPWIFQGLLNIVLKVPKRSTLRSLDNNDNEYVIESELKHPSMGNSELTEREKDYREWLAESEELHRGAHFNLKAEIETEDELDDGGGVRTPVPGQGSEAKKEGSPLKLSKAAKLVDKISNSTGIDLKRVLFSLKTFFQTDKDLVYEFVKEGGLAQLVELGKDDEAQLQNLVLRSLGQLMLYVDGMNGVMENTQAIQFLYNLIASGSRNALVCKTAVKLLLVFVEYTEKNCALFVQAVNSADQDLGVIPWTNLMDVLKQGTSLTSSNSVDKELAMYSLTLMNKSLYGIPSQDMFFDQTDYLDQLGMEDVIECVTSSLDTSENTDEGLLQQVQLYNVSLKQEDGEPVTEDDIKYLDEDATEMGLRTTLRTKSGKDGYVRKSLRYKTARLADTDFDESGDMEGITIRDVEMILAKNGLPTSKSTEELNKLHLEGVLEKARSLYLAKISKGEVYLEPGAENEATEDEPPAEQVDDDDPELVRRVVEEKWNDVVANMNRPLVIGDYDFTDLQDDTTVSPPQIAAQSLDACGIPLPPPIPPIPPPPAPPPIPPPPMPATMNGQGNTKWQVLPQKAKKTTKLFWKEVRDQPFPTIWDDMEPAEVDSAMIEYLFESRVKECISKETKNVVGTTKEIIVLDHKRSNTINIGMTKLPPPRIIKSAVMKMDSATMNRDGVEKLLTMLPTEEETVRIQEAQEVQPDIPLGTAEQFLLTLSSINCLEARLRLWSFKMEMEVVEKEVCDPLIDLKTGLDALQKNQTFKTILNILLTIGNFLNGSHCKGFQLDYLEKVPEVKDTVHKHSLLYHMTYWVLETSPNSSDLYSEIGPLTRASRTDFEELSRTLKRMESECKSAWNYLRIVCNQDSNLPSCNIPNDFETKMSDFLHDAAERILVMDSVHKKIMRRYQEFLKWMGIASHFLNDYKVHHLCKILSEFALEYRTTRERVIETIQKKKAAREKKRQAKKAALLAEAAALEALEQVQLNVSRRPIMPSRLDNVDDEQLRFLLASNNIDITENGTLRRKKKHHRSSREHHRHPRDESAHPPEESKKSNDLFLGEKLERKARRHRSSVLEGTMPLTEETFKNFTSNEMERGLLETLMATSDSSTLKRSKERRRSVKEKRSSKSSTSGASDLLRSRTRENLLPEESLL